MFVIVWCLQVVGGVTSSFWAACIHFGFVFFVLQTCLDVYFVTFNLVYLVVEFLLGFFGSFRAWFFCSANQLATSICACSFSFFLAPLFVLLPSICLWTFISDRTPLVIPKFLHMILSEHHNHLWQHAAFFGRDHAFKKMSWSTICVFFCLVFASLLDYASIRTHPNRSIPICTTFCQTPQNMMSGEISPAIGDQILTCATINILLLPCCCVPRAPYVPTHPSTPIHTHLHLSVPVCTLHFHVYMYNLIKK